MIPKCGKPCDRPFAKRMGRSSVHRNTRRCCATRNSNSDGDDCSNGEHGFLYQGLGSERGRTIDTNLSRCFGSLKRGQFAVLQRTIRVLVTNNYRATECLNNADIIQPLTEGRILVNADTSKGPLPVRLLVVGLSCWGLLPI